MKKVFFMLLSLLVEINYCYLLLVNKSFLGIAFH